MEIESNALKGFKHHILNLEKMMPVQMQKCSLHKREKYDIVIKFQNLYYVRHNHSQENIWFVVAKFSHQADKDKCFATQNLFVKFSINFPLIGLCPVFLSFNFLNDFFHNLPYSLIKIMQKSRQIIQSNLCTATTLGTRKKWSLFRGGRYSEGQKFYLNKKFH